MSVESRAGRRFPLHTQILLGMVGVPGEGIALALGIDRILDMARTVPDVSADLLTSLWVTRSEGLAFATPGTAAGDVSYPRAIDVSALAPQPQETAKS